MKVWEATLSSAIERLVREGRAVYAIVDGKPGLRLIKKDEQPKPEGEPPQ